MRPGETRYLYVFLMTLWISKKLDSMTFLCVDWFLSEPWIHILCVEAALLKVLRKSPVIPAVYLPGFGYCSACFHLQDIQLWGQMTDPIFEGPLWSSPVILQENVVSEEPLRELGCLRNLKQFHTYHPNGRTREDLNVLALDGEVKSKSDWVGAAESAALLPL